MHVWRRILGASDQEDLAHSMSDGGSESVIHRKAKVAREDFDAREMSPSKALRLALAKSADAMFDLALVVRTVEQRKVPLSEVEEMTGEDGLLMLLDGATGVPGAIKLDLSCVMALIEVQLMGEVREAEAVERPFTPTDAAIVQPMMNAVLSRFAETLASQTGTPAEAFQFGDMVEDGRTLALALNALDYDFYRMTVDFGPGAKTGVMDFYLPQRPPEPKAKDPADGAALSGELEAVALNAPVMLDAILGKLHRPLNEVCDWAPGMVVPLDLDALSHAALLAAQGHVVARVKLGQMNGFRAVRLTLAGHENASVEGAVDPPVQLAAQVPQIDLDQLPAQDGVLSLSESAAADAQIVTLSPHPHDGLETASSDPDEAQDLDISTLAMMGATGSS